MQKFSQDTKEKVFKGAQLADEPTSTPTGGARLGKAEVEMSSRLTNSLINGQLQRNLDGCLYRTRRAKEEAASDFFSFLVLVYFRLFLLHPLIHITLLLLKSRISPLWNKQSSANAILCFVCFKSSHLLNLQLLRCLNCWFVSDSVNVVQNDKFAHSSLKWIPKYPHTSWQNCHEERRFSCRAFSSPLNDINHPAFWGQDVDRGKRVLDGSRSLLFACTDISSDSVKAVQEHLCTSSPWYELWARSILLSLFRFARRPGAILWLHY